MNTRTVTRILPFLCACVLLCAASSSAISVSSGYIGAGPRFNIVVAEDIGAAIGGGAHMLIGFDLGSIGALFIYPNMEMWWGREEYDNNPPQLPDQELNAFEISINADARYHFPVPVSLILSPYVGLGFAGIVSIKDWDPGDDDTDVGPAFNMLAGIDFPFASVHKVFCEFKGKFGEDYDLMKLTVGLSFSLR
jgi:hypothetical protein